MQQAGKQQKMYLILFNKCLDGGFLQDICSWDQNRNVRPKSHTSACGFPFIRANCENSRDYTV